MELWEMSASDLSRGITGRDFAPSEVMAAHLGRVAAVNGAVNALVSLRDPDDLMAEARAADDGAGGWLHGLPLAVKDLCATKGLRTTWGSPLYRDVVPVKDDLLAARMRGAGAIFVAKTNTPEWGHGSHTFNPVFGATRNPYDLGRTAGGSSGGAAAGLAARMIPVADGSDMMGSLRNPAGFCNVYGFRPSWGLVPADAEGDSFLATLATEGPMGRTIEDVARLLAVQAGGNPEVPFGRAPSDFTAGLERASLRGKRIAWLGDWGGAYAMEPGVLDICRNALRQMEALGAVVEEVAPPFPAGDLWRAWVTLRAMLNSNGFADLVADPAKRAQIKPETLWEIEAGTGMSAELVYRASVIRSTWYATVARLFQRFDALALPTAQVWPFDVNLRWPAEIAGTRMDTYHRWMEVVIPVSLAGLPCLSLPVGFGAQGLPMGLQLAGPVGADAAVLAMGQAWHLATDWPGQRPPVLQGDAKT
ncbi:amidase [Rhodobacter sp. KR11]|uniref:amidase n=1 Tax=Rhodobacter sp. KR11 TaxID=2974588 RepID=UPI0022239D55|nr:amidase [Rhodobacter sp. KR11]MCW1920070.1 amidase [Rhodobacter sp. KR11]